jgi:diacylglycerol kinase (ATP)
MANMLPSKPKVLILFNPFAGQAYNLKRSLEAAADIWQSRGWQVELRPTKAPGDATIQAKAAANAGYDVVAAAGGDGTVNEVMNGLVGTNTALAVLPVGTVNIWARELGLSMEPKRAATNFLDAHLEKIDVGKAGTRYFLLMAGIGFDAAVTAGISSHIRIDGKRIRGRILMVVIGNSQLYGGVVKLTAHAIVNDGLLDICIIKGYSMLTAPLRLLSVFTRRYNQDPKVAYYRAKRIQIKGKKAMAVQVDGDYLGMTPMNFQVVPSSLWVLVPPGTEHSLWKT